MKIIDGNNLILGRVASYVAKAAILGDKIAIVNTDKLVMSGSRSFIIPDQRLTQDRRGKPNKGVFYQRQPDRFVKRVIRRMLPQSPRGRVAFKNIYCYIGVPEEYKAKKLETIESAHADKLQTKHMTVGEICHDMGGTWYQK
ncbi:MAG TPA: 50S ribosomal protein L13 [Candidatus Nanoarchaeia archaeon]|nr:50S ribosomal protein L13 [Candidatus Nanoarchaeia archaeon]